MAGDEVVTAQSFLCERGHLVRRSPLRLAPCGVSSLRDSSLRERCGSKVRPLEAHELAALTLAGPVALRTPGEQEVCDTYSVLDGCAK